MKDPRSGHPNAPSRGRDRGVGAAAGATRDGDVGLRLSGVGLHDPQPPPAPLAVFWTASEAATETPPVAQPVNWNTVWVEDVWPALNSVDGKLDWLGESGKCWVSNV